MTRAAAFPYFFDERLYLLMREIVSCKLRHANIEILVPDPHILQGGSDFFRDTRYFGKPRRFLRDDPVEVVAAEFRDLERAGKDYTFDLGVR